MSPEQKAAQADTKAEEKADTRKSKSGDEDAPTRTPPRDPSQAIPDIALQRYLSPRAAHEASNPQL